MKTARRTINEQAEHEFEIKNNRRVRNEDRAWNRYCVQADKAESMIGELVRDGKAVFYVFPAGGKYREGSKIDLTDFLIRNGYV